MQGLMMDMPLLISGLIQYAAAYHGEAEIVAREIEGDIHRYTYADAHPRIKRMALALKPKLLLMDEPTSGVASSEKLGIMDILTTALAKEKVTSVFVEHDMDMVERYANRVAVWNMGKIQKVGTPAEVLADPKVREQVIGI